MTLALDLDGVLADFNTAFARLGGLSVADGFAPDFWHWPQAHGLNLTALWARVRADDRFWLKLAPYPGTAAFLSDLHDWARTGDHRVVFLTSRPEGRGMIAQSEAWLMSQGWLRPTVLRSDRKADVMTALEIPLLVDDRPETLWAVRQAGHTGVLLRRPWNQPHGQHPDEIITLAELFGRYL